MPSFHEILLVDRHEALARLSATQCTDLLVSKRRTYAMRRYHHARPATLMYITYPSVMQFLSTSLHSIPLAHIHHCLTWLLTPFSHLLTHLLVGLFAAVPCSPACLRAQLNASIKFAALPFRVAHACSHDGEAACLSWPFLLWVLLDLKKQWLHSSVRCCTDEVYTDCF